MRTPLFILALLTSIIATAQQPEQRMFRMSEIDVHPQFLAEYKAILKEEAEASVRLEPGVIAIFPMFAKDDSTQVRILEIYADAEAYQSHLKTPHFQHYKVSTLKMVKSLRLVDMDVLDEAAMPMMFRKVEAVETETK